MLRSIRNATLFVLAAALLAAFILLAMVPGDAASTTAAEPKPIVPTCSTVSAKRFNAALKTRRQLGGKAPRKYAHKPVCIRPHYRKVTGQINSRYRVCANRGDPKCRWLLRWKELSAYDRTWTLRIGACESGNNPKTDTGNGFLGAHQWVLTTAVAAGFRAFRDASGHILPATVTSTSWHEQAVRAVRWRNRTSTMQWPACSRSLGYA